jgi:hypothetical protein
MCQCKHTPIFPSQISARVAGKDYYTCMFALWSTFCLVSLSFRLKFIRDPYTTFDQLKSLRLVCRIFSDVAGRRVLSRVRLFRRVEDPWMEFLPPLSVISLELNCDLYETSTLVADWRNTNRSMFMSFREMRKSNKWVLPIIENFTLVPFVYLLRFIFCPDTLPLCIYSSINRLRSKYRLSRASVFNTPNVRRFM